MPNQHHDADIAKVEEAQGEIDDPSSRKGGKGQAQPG
jgi:hypothetical protein